MPAPAGNQNEANGKRWAGAIRRALHEYSDERIKQGEALLEIAKGVVKDALGGDALARKEIGDRLDGRPPQGVTLSGDPDNPIQTRRVVELINGAAAKPNGHAHDSTAGET